MFELAGAYETFKTRFDSALELYVSDQVALVLIGKRTLGAPKAIVLVLLELEVPEI